MKILLSNDDGVDASGILALSNQQSGIGHALTLYESLRIDKTILRDGSIAYSVSGTPTDAVTLGIYEIMDEKPDLVISGINTGQNTGKGELTTSGTLGAAMEAASLGIPAIAVSQHIDKDEVKFDEGAVEIDFSSTQRVVKNLVKKIRDKGMPGDIKLLNLNVPSNPDSYEPVITGLANRMRGKPYYWITGELHTDNPVDTDGYILQNKNLPTLTPLSLDMTYGLDILKDWI